MPRHLRSWSYATSSKSSTVRSIAPASSPTTASCSPPPADCSQEFAGMSSRCAPRPSCAGTIVLSPAERRGGGARVADRPSIPRDLRDLIVRFAKDNPRWGYKRIQGELKKLGHEVSAMTIRDVLRRSGVGPAPRRMGPSWSEFLRAQASAIPACDFFTVYGAWGRTIYVLFAIELSRRRVHLAGCTARPNDAWVTQQARNLLMAFADPRQRLSLPHPRPRHEVHRRVRRGLSNRRNRNHQDSDPSASSERHRRALDQIRTDRASRLGAHPRRAPPQSGAQRIC
jgi:hypothetical protein